VLAVLRWPRVRPGAQGGFHKLVDELRDRVRYLERQVEKEREARRRADTLLARLMDPVPELEPPSNASETIEEEPEEAEPQPATGEVREELSAEQARRETAESTLHEGMTEERRRREEAERERDEPRRELFGLRGRTQAHEVAEEQQGRVQPPIRCPRRSRGRTEALVAQNYRALDVRLWGEHAHGEVGLRLYPKTARLSKMWAQAS
jgi:hypothetical protein